MTTGFTRIVRLIAKRERFVSLIWFVGFVGITLSFGGMFTSLFPDEASLTGMAAALDTPAMTAMMGPVYGLESLTPAMLMAMQMRIWMMLAAAIMNIFFVCRHTRGDEEPGRWEMLRSLPVASITGALAAYTSAVVLNVLIGLASAVGLLILNIPGTTAAGAFCYAFAIAAVGIVFAGITLLTAQLFPTARGALTGAFALLGIAFAMRASGDISQNALSVLSPLGLGLAVEAFYTNGTVPILLLLAESLVFFALAILFASRRDLGEGILPARKGRRHAPSWMLSPAGLALRLTRNQIIIWAVAMFAIGAMYGPVIGDIDSFTASNDVYRQMLEAAGSDHNLSESFIAMLFGIFAAISAIPSMTHALKIRGEEKRGRLDQVFSKAVSRSAMLGGYAWIAFAESLLMPLMIALGFYCTASSSASISLGMVLQAALVYLPALWTMIGLCLFLVGLLPKATALVWGLYAYVFFMVFYAKILSLPAWVVALSPFTNIPQLPAAQFQWLPEIIQTLIGAALALPGFRHFRRRDVLSA